MTHPHADPDVGLAAFLATRARSASDMRLALNAGLGLLALGAALQWHPPGWFVLACAGGSFAAYGAWGIADRELLDHRATAPRSVVAGLRAVRAVVAAIGAVAALLTMFGALAIALGRFIS